MVSEPREKDMLVTAIPPLGQPESRVAIIRRSPGESAGEGLCKGSLCTDEINSLQAGSRRAACSPPAAGFLSDELGIALIFAGDPEAWTTCQAFERAAVAVIASDEERLDLSSLESRAVWRSLSSRQSDALGGTRCALPACRTPPLPDELFAFWIAALRVGMATLGGPDPEFPVSKRNATNCLALVVPASASRFTDR
jgi:hypothetical protein